MLAEAAAAIVQGIAANFATRMLQVSAQRVRRGFDDHRTRAALDAAVGEAMEAGLAVAVADGDEDEKTLLARHYEGLLREFFGRDAVVEELAQVLDPRPGARPDAAVLARELEAVGWAPELAVGFDAPAFAARFTAQFWSTAGRQEALRGRIQLRLLGEMVEGLGAVAGQQERTAAAAERTADGVADLAALVRAFVSGQADERSLSLAGQAVARRGYLPAWSAQQEVTGELLRAGIELAPGRDGGIGLRQGTGEPAVTRERQAALLTVLEGLRAVVLGHEPDEAELDELERRYRAHLVRWFENLTFQGLQASARPIVLPLAEVYVELRAVAEVPEAADAFSAEERRLLLDADEGAPEARRELLRQLDTLRRERWSRSLPQRKPIAEALYAHDRGGLVILGDPGSGKTTLLHVLTLLHARGEAAVAERLGVAGAEAGRLPVFVPLAAYDGLRREVPGLTLRDFLERYYDLRRGLPGLAPLFRRAVEAGRALVLFDGLDEVLDTAGRAFVAEQVGALVGEWAPRGVRFAITSRIVGYREAPVPGGLPTWSVLDFAPREIELFAHRWALAYERWAAGGESVETLQRARALERDLMADVASSDGVRRLAANPLMLTMLALLRRQVGPLPRRRVLLYESYLGTLLDSWIEARSQGARERSRDRLDRLQAENLLIPLALWMHEHRPSGTAGLEEVRRCLTDARLSEAGTSRDRATLPELRQAEGEAERFSAAEAGAPAPRGRGGGGLRPRARSPLQGLDPCTMPRSAHQPHIQSDQRRAEQLGQRDVGRVVGRQVAAQRPDAGQQQLMRVPLERQVGEVLQRLARAFGGKRTLRDETAQHLSDLEVQQVGRVQRGVRRRQQTVDQPFAHRRPQQHLESRRRVEHDHRPSRSVATAEAIGSPGSAGWRRRSRSSISSRGGRSKLRCICRSR